MKDLKSTVVHKRFKILLIGDSCEDVYYIGSVDRISPEAPVPILKISEHFRTPGMAANVRKNFVTINQNVEFISEKSKITKTRYIDKKSGQQLLRVDDEPKIAKWNGNFQLFRDLSFFDAIVISDYNKGFLSYEHIENIISKSKVPVFIDTKKVDLAKFEGAFIKINLAEFNNLTSTPKERKGLIVTNGDRGAMYNDKIYPAPKVEVSDVCGAGDTFLAFLVYGYLLYEKNIDKAIEIANQAASISVRHRGNYAPRLSELELFDN